MHQIFFSIITINLNNKPGLLRTIESVVSQTYTDFEYIVIDGASKDGSQEVIQKYADQIDYWVSEPDNGIYQAMNKGVKVAKGDFLLFLNSGDTLADNSVLNFVSLQILPDDIICSGLMQIDKGRSTILIDPPSEITLDFLLDGSLPHQATFFNTEVFRTFGLYDENLKIAGDWAYLFRILIIENLRYRKIPILISTFDGYGISSKPEFFPLQAKEREEFLKSIFNERIYRSLNLFRTVTYISSTKQYQLFERIQKSRHLRIVSYLFLKFLIFFSKK